MGPRAPAEGGLLRLVAIVAFSSPDSGGDAKAAQHEEAPLKPVKDVRARGRRSKWFGAAWVQHRRNVWLRVRGAPPTRLVTEVDPGDAGIQGVVRRVSGSRSVGSGGTLRVSWRDATEPDVGAGG